MSGRDHLPLSILARFANGITLGVIIAISATSPTFGQGKWIVTDPMRSARDAHSAILLGNRVLLIGGRIRARGTTTARCEWYDSKSRHFVEAETMVSSRAFVPSILLNTRVVVLGGFRQTGDSDEHTIADGEVYALRSERWQPGPGLKTPRELATVSQLRDGSLLIAGGFSNNAILRSAELLLSRNRSLVPTGAMETPRFGHVSMRQTNRIWVLGGRTQQNVSLSSTEWYDPDSRTWSPGPHLQEDRFRPTLTELKDGRILVTGGYSSLQNRTLTTAEIYNPDTDQFTLLTSTMSDGRMDHTATLLQDGRVLIVGGWCSQKSRTVPTADLFDPGTNTFKQAATLPVSRHEHSATRLPDGSILIAGGLEFDPAAQRTLNDAYLFVP